MNEIIASAHDEMKATMGLLGVALLFFSLLFPGLSDRIGRKQALFITIVIGFFYPFVVYFLNGSGFHLPLMLLTYSMVGVIPIVVAVIPSESVPAHLKGRQLA